MKILHINDTLERGGAETLLVNTVKAISERFPTINQTVVTLYNKGELKNELGNISYYSLNFKLSNPVPSIFRLRKLIKKLNIQVVHSHLLHSTFLARLALPHGVGLVSTYHSVFYEPTMVTYAKYERLIDKLTYKNKFFTIFVSEAVQENITKAVNIKENYKVLVNFASPKFKYSWKFNPENELKIVMVGNLHEIKNHEIAIKALSHLPHQSISLDIYGDGGLRKHLEDIITQTNTKVRLMGITNMTSDILGKYDLYMMTSRHEGMPLSLLEALQSGMPCLLNSVSMLIETAGNASIYYNYNSLDSLVEKLTFIIKNKQLLPKLSENALVRSELYSVDNYLNALIEIYKHARIL